MKKNYLKKWLAMTLALTMTVSSSGLAVLAAEEPEEAAVTQAAGRRRSLPKDRPLRRSA